MQLQTITHQTIALAGVAQAAALVQQLATTGTADPTAMEVSIGSILKVDTDTVIDVYGSLAGLQLGLEQLKLQMGNYKIANPEQARYAASLVFLESQLSKQPKMLKTISTGIEKAENQAGHFGLLHENVLANLADIYSNTVSKLQPKIMVNGETQHLTNTYTADKIRACLLAGIRSVILWRQCGGTRWKFLFQRKKIQAELQVLLTQI
jgi:high frequency lysogenization protein